MGRYHFARTFLVLFSIAVSGTQVRAECLWDEKADLDSRFKAFVTKSAPRYCRPVAYGYTSLFSPAAGTLKFEMVVRARKLCFSRIIQSLKKLEQQNQLISCRSTKASTVESYPAADGGPTLMFTFKASAAEIKEASRYGTR
jgi:hypothetical protein